MWERAAVDWINQVKHGTSRACLWACCASQGDRWLEEENWGREGSTTVSVWCGGVLLVSCWGFFVCVCGFCVVVCLVFLIFVCFKENLHWSRIRCSLVMRTTQVILINYLLASPANTFESSGGYSASWTQMPRWSFTVCTHKCMRARTHTLVSLPYWILQEHDPVQSKGFGMALLIILILDLPTEPYCKSFEFEGHPSRGI